MFVDSDLIFSDRDNARARAEFDDEIIFAESPKIYSGVMHFHKWILVINFLGR